MLAALAFDQTNNIFEYFDQLRYSIQQIYAGDCEEALDNFEDCYIGHFPRNALRKLPQWITVSKDHKELSKLAYLSFL